MKRFVVATLLAVFVAGAVGVCATDNPASAFYNRGNAYQAKGQNDQAIADYNQAIKLKPDLAGAFINRGAAYNEKGQNDQAIADYNQAIKLNPNIAGAFNNRGNAYQAKDQNDQAIADYNQAIKLNPNFADAFYGRGNAYQAKGENDQAIADFGQAIKLNPNDARAFNNRGKVYQAKGQNDQAIADFGQAIKLNPNDTRAFYNRSAAYQAKGQNDQAIADHNQAIKLNPNLAVAASPVPLVEAALSRLIDLTPESTNGTSTNVAAGRTEASQCVHATRLASTYSSRVLFKVTNGNKQLQDIQWRVDYSAPDKYHVLQSAGQLFDEWITIGTEAYSNAGFWFKWGSNAGEVKRGQRALNKFFAVDKFLHVLAAAEPTSAIEYSTQDARYLLLEYREQLGADFTPLISKTATEPSQVRIWIDRQTDLLAKGEVTARDSANGTQLFLQQVFSGYSEAIRIEPPVIANKK